MAKSRRNNRKPARPPQSREQQSAKALREAQAADVQRAVSTAEDQAEVVAAAEHEALEPPVIDVPPADTEDRLLKAYDALVEQRGIYEHARDRAAEREGKAAAAIERAETAALAVEAERAEILEARSKLQALQTETAAKVKAFRTREAELLDLEMRATEGFQDVLDRRERAISERLQFEYDQRLAAVTAGEAAVEERQRQLDEDRAELIDKAADLRTREYAVLRRNREIDTEVASRSAERIQDLETKERSAKVRIESAEAEIDRLEREQAATRAKWAAVGNRDPQELLRELEHLRVQTQEQRSQLEERLADDDLDRLHFLEGDNQRLREERQRLQYLLDEMESRAVYDQASHLKVQQLKEAQNQYDLVVRGYQQQLGTLSESYEKLIASRADDPTAPLFPACIRIDEDEALALTAAEDNSEIDLHRFARNLQGAMWKYEQRAYRLDDICAFLGGMAMSRLHLLEGMSGIGKTSLPKAFARVLQAHCEIIEVQAGWRDKHDLFGHYNAYENRFEETRFLEALYKAGSPRHENRPFFIVLDEMNLSRPEQYFSILLSRLESEDETPIGLTQVSSGRSPARFKLNGTGIEIPPNVWFIGTANQDESTLEFADKTYNRAFLLELPSDRPWVPSGGGVEPYTHSALRRAFDKAKGEHREEVAAVRQLLNDLRGELFETGRVQVGPRLDAQLEKFLPVFVAARGTESETRQDAATGDCEPTALAADQFIASKVLRQIRSRFEVTTEGIDRLSRELDIAWEVYFPGTSPARCSQVLSDERRRRSA